MHVDFLRVTGNTHVVVEVPVHFINEEKSPGIKAGGVLNVVRHAVELHALAGNIPDSLTADLTGLKVGEGIHISNIKLPKGTSPVITDRDFTIATIAVPAAGVQEEETEAEASE